MEYKLYADVWFLTNFIMDSVALGIATKIMKQRIRIKRLFFAGFIGTAGSMGLFFVMNDYILYQLLVHLLINPLMVWLCCPGKQIRAFIGHLVFTYLAMILLGGILEWGTFYLGTGKYFAVCLLAGIIFLWAADNLQEYFRRQKNTIYDLILMTKEGTISVKGFFDTGNLLIDPMVGKPVHIIKKKILEKQIEEGRLLVRLIPFHSLGRENGILETVSIEGMYILKEGQSLYLEHPVLGLAEEKLFQHHRGDVIMNGKSR